MKKYKLTLLIGIIIIIFSIQISKPNSGLDYNTLFKLIDITSNKTDNLLQVNSLYINKNNYKEDTDTKNIDNGFFRSFFNYLFNRNGNEKKDNISVAPTKPLAFFKNTSRYEMIFDDSVEPNSFFISDYFMNNNSEIQTQNFIKKDNTGTYISNNTFNLNDGELRSINPFEKSTSINLKFLNYKELVKLLKDSSNFIDYSEIDEKYVFMQEFDSVSNVELNNFFKKLKLDKSIDESGILTYEELTNSNWNSESVLVNFIVPSSRLQITNFILSIKLIKEDIEYNINLSMDFEQFNILNNFSIPKELQ